MTTEPTTVENPPCPAEAPPLPYSLRQDSDGLTLCDAEGEDVAYIAYQGPTSNDETTARERAAALFLLRAVNGYAPMRAALEDLHYSGRRNTLTMRVVRQALNNADKAGETTI